VKTWKRIEPTKTTKVGWRTVVTKTFEMPNGETTSFDLLHPDGQAFVGVIGLTPGNEVIVAHEFYPGPELMMDDMPGGFVDPGEDLEVAARREFLEETGYEPATMKYLGVYHKDKYMNASWHSFLATGCARVQDQNLETEEFIDVTLLSIKKFLDNAKNDRMTDHGAVLLAYDELMKIMEDK
jgi:ADP-ribose pyrophosphatase